MQTADIALRTVSGANRPLGAGFVILSRESGAANGYEYGQDQFRPDGQFTLQGRLVVTSAEASSHGGADYTGRAPVGTVRSEDRFRELENLTVRFGESYTSCGRPVALYYGETAVCIVDWEWEATPASALDREGWPINGRKAIVEIRGRVSAANIIGAARMEGERIAKALERRAYQARKEAVTMLDYQLKI